MQRGRSPRGSARGVIATAAPPPPPPPINPLGWNLWQRVAAGAAAVTGTALLSLYVLRARLIEYYLWKTQGLRLRFTVLQRTGRSTYRARAVRVLAPPAPGTREEREASRVADIEASVDVGELLARLLPWNQQRTAQRGPVQMDVAVHEPHLTVEFDNYELTESNWRAIAREMAAARRRRRLQQPQPAARKLGASPCMLDKLSIVGNAHVRVQSRAVDQVLVPDVELSGGEVRFLELIRSPESACAELERLAAKRLLAAVGTAELSQETRQHLETYARSVLSKTTEELRARGQQRLKQMTDALRQAGKAIDSAALPPDQAEKLKGFTGKAQKRIDGVDQWLHSLDRERKGERPAPKGKK